MINYFNFKKMDDMFLITNDFGEYAFLNPENFEIFVKTGKAKTEEMQKMLIKKKFIYESSTIAFSEFVKYYMRDAKNYLFESTQLHIFVVTTSCNQKCVYCQAQSGTDIPNGFMDKDTAKKAVDVALQSPSKGLQFEFQGGEPLLNFEIIKFIVEYSKEHAQNKNIDYSIVSNLTLLTDEILDFIQTNHIGISTSLDGDEITHNLNRPYRDRTGTYQSVMKSLIEIRNRDISVGAIQTTSRYSLNHCKEIIDTYVELGFDNISLRALTPLGCANKNWKEIGYSASEFLNFYNEVFNYIIEINKNGYRLKEGLASIFLNKILEGVSLNYMELRSPCGASIGQIAYYVDGNVYTCDEGRMLAEMGNDAFHLGNLENDDYNSLMNSKVCKAACTSSILESLPSCSDCVYQPYCGTCPVVNFSLYGDIYEREPGNYRCTIYKGMLDLIFNKLKENNAEIENIFRSWIG